jgi:hypothetical protein
MGVLVSEAGRLVEERTLDFIEDLADFMGQLCRGKGGGIPMSFVAPGKREGARLDFPLSDFEAERNPFFDPSPAFFSSSKISGIDENFEGLSMI